MSRLFSSLLLMCVSTTCLFVGAGQAKADVMVGWTASGGIDDGDNIAISFAPFSADTLSGITGPGYLHNHGNSGAVFTLDLHVNGSWITIWSGTGFDGSDHPLANTIPTPISFAGGNVDGIRLTDNPTVGNGYHAMNNFGRGPDTVFAFGTRGTTAQPVPEPSSLAMCGIAACVIGAVRRRRGAKQAAGSA